MLLDALRSVPGARVALAADTESVTYAELLARVQREAQWLGEARIERAAVLAGNGVPWVTADLALLLGGVLSVPLPGSFTAAQMQHALDDAGIDALLTDDVARAGQLLSGWTVVSVAPASGFTLLRRVLDASCRPAVPAGCAKITYTSGSTAAPKGVCLSRRNLEAVAAALAEATRELDIARHLCILPLATLLENLAGVYAPLLVGATCVVPGPQATGMSYAGLDVARLLQCIRRHEPNSMILVPELLQVLVTAVERGWQAPASLQFLAVGGAAVSQSLLQRAEHARLPVFEGYGLSECASVVCLNTPRARKPGTVGRPLPHARVRIDAAGGVHVAGATMLGYLGDAPRDPAAEIATGDLGEFDADGYLRLRGRAGNLLITSFGRNISPEWVECEVSHRLGGRPVLAYGEARPYVTALVSASTAELDATTIEAAVAGANATLPDYAQVREWRRAPEPFSLANGLLTSNGRLRRRAIIDRHRALLEAVYDTALAS